jgi:hypothetical protein
MLYMYMTRRSISTQSNYSWTTDRYKATSTLWEINLYIQTKQMLSDSYGDQLTQYTKSNLGVKNLH